MSFFRTMIFVLLLVMLIIVAMTYGIKYNSQKLIREKDYLTRQIEIEQNLIEKLQANWAFLTSPEHIQELLNKNKQKLKLAPVSPHNIMTMKQLEKQLKSDARGRDGV